MWYNWGMEIYKDPVAIATLVLALVTAVLASTSFWIIQQNYKFREKDRKERLLNEIRAWVLEIKNISLEPISIENLSFRESNISLKYGIALNKVEYFGKAVSKMFKEDDFETKVNRVAEMLIASCNGVR